MNPEVVMTLDDAVAEVLGMLTGLDLTYEPELDRYRAITRQLNRALRANALEAEWSCYADTLAVGTVVAGSDSVQLPPDLRPRVINDDAVRLVDADGNHLVWAYFLPRDAIHKYRDRQGLWCSATKQSLLFSRPFYRSEEGLEIHLPVMREPRMFRLPASGSTVGPSIRKQPIDFAYPDLPIARAAYFYSLSDPIMQPRAQTLEAGYKELMYQLIERDTSITDTPYINETILPIQNGLVPQGFGHLHPHAN
jgi:hypothetical protein